MKSISIGVIVSVLLCWFLILTSCGLICKQDPAKYYVSDYSKTWISYAGSQLPFRNQNSDVAFFVYSHPTDDMESSYFRGEECGDEDLIETIKFNLTSATLQYGFDFTLISSFYGANELFVSSSNSTLSLQFIFQNDTLNNGFYSEFLSQINLNGILFENVYRSGLDSTTTSTVTDIYFTKPNGIVGFKTKDGNTWSLL